VIDEESNEKETPKDILKVPEEGDFSKPSTLKVVCVKKESCICKRN
jgi:hypothetical protein